MSESKSRFRTSVFLRYVQGYFSHLFNLQEGKADDDEVIEDIRRGVAFRGTNLWILICAIFICSIGLNVNSTAVVIGAMLISPLMGPIIGVGLGVGILDLDLIRRALKNLAIAAGISVLSSTIYFLITPLSDAQTEILARTTPTLWDVVIALFGGFAGIIASTRQDKSNAIPGVAIATALMPPLCTAGYGIATGQWPFFIGAFYLFSINCVFITLSTFLIVKYLRFRPRHYVDDATDRRVKLWVGFFVLATAVPSVFLAANVVRKSLFERNARDFIEAEVNTPNTQIINQQFVYDRDTSRIILTCMGQTLDSNRIRKMSKGMTKYGLGNTQLIVRQNYNEVNAHMLDEFNTNLRTGILEDLYKKNVEIVQNKDARINMLEQEIARYRIINSQSGDIGKEIKVNYPNINEFSLSMTPIFDLKTAKADTAYLAYAKFAKRPSWRETKRMEDWLKVRVKSKDLRLVVQ